MIGLAMALLAAAAADPGPVERCDPPSGWDAVAARDTRYVVFGEIHGTAESPAFVGDVACALAFRGERLLIAVEEPSGDDAALQAAWRLDDAAFGAAVRQLGWWRDDGDGRGSIAMQTLIIRLHRLRSGGRPIDLVAFADEPAQRRRFADLPGQGPQEAAKAANIRLAEAGRHDRVLVLTGSVHAAKRPVTRGTVTFQPMAMQLAAADAVTSLDMRTSGGTSWNCELRPGATVVPNRPVPTAAMHCAPHRLGTSASLVGPRAIGLGAAPGGAIDPAYDGWFWLGRVTASPPAADPRP